MFYTGGLPFNLARNPYFRNAFMFATNNPIGGYVPPSYKKLRTTLLVQERTHVERMLQPLKETWSSKGVSIVSDGWEIEDVLYMEFQWISEVIGDASMIKNFIMNHSMRLSMFNEQSNLKFLAIADTRFASAIVVLKRLIAIKDALSVMVMWDTMIEKVKSVIYRHEMKETHEESIFYSAVHDILVSRWTKSNTPLHCLAHSLNPKYYTDAWINEVPNRQAPHNDDEISEMRNTCFRRYFSGEELKKIKLQYANFSLFGHGFNSFDSFEDRNYMEPKMWWGIHGHSAPELKKLALKLLGQPASSSCAQRNWSTYGLIHSSLRNRLNPRHAEDLVFTHQNLRLLSRKSDEYRCGPSAMWDVGADFEGGADFLEQADLSLDEPELEERLFEDLEALGLTEDAE
ncbi:hAT transposon superfamily protein [Zea mays]|uniref:HAT transposon superfamily protein n=1 Tax=Zea mays TaxID=4577 RepID=A0A1D6MTF4_MAIZE|nr:hAT transposon superfamily protein [Zea mays]